jgi:drug/metabolite transporter (DMT)-like permease
MPRSENHTGRAALFVIAASCCFGSISVLTTIALRDGVPLVTIMFWRYALATIALAGIVGANARRGVGTSAEPRTPVRLSWTLLIVGGIGQTAVSYTSLRALEYISVATLAFLFYTYPAWVAVYSALRRTDRITPVRLVALVVALVGVAAIVGSPFDARIRLAGVALALASAVIYGVYLPYVDALQRGMTPMVAALHIAAGTSVIFGVAMLAHGGPFLPPTVASGASILTLALACTVLGFWLVLAGMDTIGPVRTAIIATVEPFYTTLLGAAVLAQAPGVNTGIGGALIAIAVIVIQRAGRNESVAAAPEPV